MLRGLKVVAVIQARMTSTRLPGKVLVDLAGAPMFEREIARLRQARSLDEIVLATTTNATDDPVVELAGRLGVGVFRGSEHDVLSRFAGAAAQSAADVIVRVTADCPLIDAAVTDDVVRALEDGVAYASNVTTRTYPRGLDVEAFTRGALDRCVELASSPAAREHVTWFMYREQPDLFPRKDVVGAVDGSDLRWTVDTAEDLAMVRAVYAGMGLGERQAPYEEILAWVRAHPEVSALNAGVEQKKS